MYTYDAVDNLRSKYELAPGVAIDYDNSRSPVKTATVNGAQRIFAHDGRGNVTANGVNSFVYDVSDRMATLKSLSGSVIESYVYDGALKRVKTTDAAGKVVYSVYGASGALLMYEDAATSTKTDYVSVAGRPVARVVKVGGGYGSVTVMHGDHLGSVAASTDNAGAVSWRERYTPFGETLDKPARMTTSLASPAISATRRRASIMPGRGSSIRGSAGSTGSIRSPATAIRGRSIGMRMFGTTQSTAQI